MGFVVSWLWYLIAFAAGSGVAWLVGVLTIRRTSREEALTALASVYEGAAH